MVKRKKPNSPTEEMEMRHQDSEKNLTSISPFLIEKCLRNAVNGQLKSVKN